jgi:hypothetical protein
MAIVAKFISPKNADKKIRINIAEQEDGKKGFPAFLNEVINDKTLPGHRVHLYLNEHAGQKWFTVSGPLRKTNEQGEFIIIPRKNKDGALVDDKGQVVTEESKAGRSFEYIKDREDQIVYGTLGTLNIQNLKADKTPTKQTLVSFYSIPDSKALEIERTVFALTSSKKVQNPNPEQISFYEKQLNEQRKGAGSYSNMFITEGKDFLTKLGFEVRLDEKESTPTPN